MFRVAARLPLETPFNIFVMINQTARLYILIDKVYDDLKFIFMKSNKINGKRGEGDGKNQMV